MRILKRLGYSILLVLAVGADATACTCDNTSGDTLFRVADAVFAGTVTAVEGDKVTFEVEKSWKYVRSRRVAVYDTGAGSCRWEYKAGDRMIIHASAKGGSLYTHMCMGFGAADRPGPRFANLESMAQLVIDEGPGAKPDNSAGRGELRAVEGTAVLVAAGTVLALLGIILLVRRGGRRAA